MGWLMHDPCQAHRIPPKPDAPTAEEKADSEAK